MELLLSQSFFKYTIVYDLKSLFRSIAARVITASILGCPKFRQFPELRYLCSSRIVEEKCIDGRCRSGLQGIDSISDDIVRKFYDLA